MDGQEKLLDYETIKAAVAGEKWATEKVLAHYADYIDELSTVEIRQPGGKVKKVIDEDMRQHISLKLLEALPSFPEYYGAAGFFRNCPFFASNEIISVIKCWYQIKAVYDNE